MRFRNLSRREFLRWTFRTTVLSSLADPFIESALGNGFIADTQSPTNPFTENLYFACNRIKEVEGGESDEFTSFAHLQRLLEKLEVPRGTTVIAIGARTGVPGNDYGLPGEIAVHWKFGERWNQWVTNPSAAPALNLGQDDPIAVTQVGVLQEKTKLELQWNQPELPGAVLWTFTRDATANNLLHVGVHNAFSDIDRGLVQTLYDAAQQAGAKNGVLDEASHSKLSAFFPGLQDSSKWARFRSTFPGGLLHERLLPLIQSSGWPGAAVVIRGQLDDVVPFRIREWVRKNPSEPAFEIGKGTHLGKHRVRFGRELTPGLASGPAPWTCVGFLWDMQRTGSVPRIQDWEDVSDIFGQDFHLHGFRDDGLAGGHILHCAAAGPLTISLYPLSFEEGQTAYLFDNDLEFVPGTLGPTSGGLRVAVWNHGENFVRNLGVSLQDPGSGRREQQSIALLSPGAKHWIEFTGEVANANLLSHRRLTLDPGGHFLQGGKGKQNDIWDFDASFATLRILSARASKP